MSALVSTPASSATSAPPARRDVKPHHPLLDPLRAIAALTVLVGHIYGYGFTNVNEPGDLGLGGRLLWNLGIGVAIFFVISGFLLYGPFVRARLVGGTVDVRQFWRNRALRIFPGYWVALGVMAIVPGLAQFDVKSALFNVTLTYVWVPGYSISGIGPAWTLCDEVAFYAVLPAASFLIARAGIRWLGKSSPMVREIAPLVAIIVVTLIFDGLLEAHDGRFGHLRSTLLGLADWFALGMILAVIHVHRRPAGPDRSWLWWAAAPPLYLLLALVGQDGIHHTLTNAIQGAFGFCLVAPAAFRSGGGRNLVERAMLRVGVLRWFGTISYGIYLWQVPWVIWLAETTNPQSGVLSAAGYVACSLLLVTVLGATSYYVVERPFLRRKHRYVATR